MISVALDLEVFEFDLKEAQQEGHPRTEEASIAAGEDREKTWNIEQMGEGIPKVVGSQLCLQDP